MTSLSNLRGENTVKISLACWFIACLYFSTGHCYWIPKGSGWYVPHFAVMLFPVWLLSSSVLCIAKYPDMWLLVLFICLQKLNTAMPPCHPSSAVERGKAWKGKTKARKTQVAGKGYSASRGHKLHTWLFVSSATSRPSYLHFKCALTECSWINSLFLDWCFFFTPLLWFAVCVDHVLHCYPFWSVRFSAVPNAEWVLRWQIWMWVTPLFGAICT